MYAPSPCSASIFDGVFVFYVCVLAIGLYIGHVCQKTEDTGSTVQSARVIGVKRNIIDFISAVTESVCHNL